MLIQCIEILRRNLILFLLLPIFLKTIYAHADIRKLCFNIGYVVFLRFSIKYQFQYFANYHILFLLSFSTRPDFLEIETLGNVLSIALFMSYFGVIF